MPSTHDQHTFVYQYMAFKSLGDLNGKRVVDMPSGEVNISDTCDTDGRHDAVKSVPYVTLTLTTG